MITNIGKSIIAKYLIGDAPAYASYIALGCGPRPRPNITTKSDVSTATLSGTIVSSQTTSAITGIPSTAGLVVGMTLTKTAGAGSLGTGSTIVSIDSINQITVTATASHTAGTITFNTGGVAQLLSVSSTSGLWIGGKISITAGTGVLSTLSDTLVTKVSSETNFTISPAPTTNLLEADLLLEIDPKKDALDFEMFRVPVSSRGYVNDNGTNKIVLTAQLPTEERYEISEIGIYSAGSNSAAGQYDSRTISAFSAEENWQLSIENALSSPSPTNPFFPEIQTSLINGSNVITNTAPAIKTSTANGIFSNATRSNRYERPRYLGNVLMLKGDTSYLYENGSSLSVYGTPAFLQLTGQPIDLSKNSSSDIMKIAFSLVSVTGNSSAVPDSVRVVVEFSNDDGSQFARMQVEAKDIDYRFSENRYIVVPKRLDELFYSSGQFSWRTANVIKAYAATVDDLLITNKELASNVATITTSSIHNLEVGNFVKISNVDSTFNGVYEVKTIPSDNTFTFDKTAANVLSQQVVPNGRAEVPNDSFYVALDALRVDNVSTINPLYGLTGYSIIQNQDQTTIVKSPNTNNYIEYRFILDVT